MIDPAEVQRVLALLDEQLRDFDDIVQAGQPDRIRRWQRATAELLSNHASPEEAADFQDAGEPTSVALYGSRSSPFALPARQRRFLQGLRDDIAKSPEKFLRKGLV